MDDCSRSIHHVCPRVQQPGGATPGWACEDLDGLGQNFDVNNDPGTVVFRCAGVSLTLRTLALGGT